MEWFEVTDNRVLGVIDRWRRCMMHQPYDKHTGMLEVVWSRSLRLPKTESSAQGDGLHQTWAPSEVGLGPRATDTDFSEESDIHRYSEKQFSF
jgi:hypothetical protein